MVNTRTRKRKRENKTPENEMQSNITKKKSKKKEPSIVYFVVLSHGEVNYTKNVNNEFKPIHVKIPDKISLFNKITYAPLGIYNVMQDQQNEIIFEKLKDEIPNLNFKTEGYGEMLANKLKNEYSQLIEDPIEGLKDETNPQSRAYFHILNNNKDQFYQSVTYDKNKNNNIPINQKRFSLSRSVENVIEFEDIVVVFQKGGTLKTGDKILRDNTIFKNYMIHLWKEQITNNIDKNNKYIYTPEITTDELLQIAVEYGYENVVIIDYSCDFCRNVVDPFSRIPRDKIIKWREEVKNKKFGRGGKKRKTVKFLKKLK